MTILGGGLGIVQGDGSWWREMPAGLSLGAGECDAAVMVDLAPSLREIDI